MSRVITLREAYTVNRRRGVWPVVAALVAIVWVVMGVRR